MSAVVSSRINRAFEYVRSHKSAALIPYICAGDPSPAITVSLMHALVRGGADVIELGVPFSDPAADGPVIQKASERALKQGTTLLKVLEMVTEFRQQNTQTPVVLMGYGNPIEAMGHQLFAERAQAAGVDGVLVVDFPPQEYGAFADDLKSRGIAPIFLLAPTSTPERIQEIAKIAAGYIYYVSLRGVTGSSALDVAEVQKRVQFIKQYATEIPVGVGFGIRDAQTAQDIASAADAVVIGSRLIQVIEQATTQSTQNPELVACRAVEEFLAEINAALLGK